MTMPTHVRDHATSVLMLCLLILSLLACSSSGLNSNQTGQYGFTAEEKQQQQDKNRIAKLEKARAEVQNLAGPQQYKDYSMAMCGAYNEGIFERYPEIDPGLPEATALGDRIASKAPYEAHTVTAFKGLMLICAGYPNEGELALIESIDIKPGRDAGEMLATLYGSSGEFVRVGETCAKVVPALAAQDRFMMMSTCKEQLHATSDESAFFWARPQDVDFWNAEQSRRAEEASRRAEAEEKERATILAQQREEWNRRRAEQREANERANREAKQRDACLAQCKQTAHLCNKDCYNEHCTFSCNKAYEGCQEECFIRYD